MIISELEKVLKAVLAEALQTVVKDILPALKDLPEGLTVTTGPITINPVTFTFKTK